MNVKELAELLKQKKYDGFCNACENMSPRTIHYIYDFIDNFQDELYNNVSPEQFKKWRYVISGD